MATINTITGLLNRINTAANLIWNKASDMALQLPAGSYWDLKSKSDKEITGANSITGKNSSEAQYKIDSNGGIATYDFGIDAVAAALYAINIQDIKEDKILSAGNSINIPVGYNKTAFTISAEGLGILLSNTNAVAKHLYTGKTAYIKNLLGNPELITGTLNKVYLDAALGEYTPNKINTDTKTLKVRISSEDNSEFLDTNIAYINPGDLVTESTTGVLLKTYTNNNTKYVEVNLAKGYYDKNIQTDIPYIDTKYTNTVEVARSTNSEDKETVTINSLEIPAGYYKKGLIITPVFTDYGNLPDNILNIIDLNLSETTIDFGEDPSKVFSPSNSGYDYFGAVTIPKATLTFNNGLVTVAKSGWVNNTDEALGVQYGTLTPELITVSDNWDSTHEIITDKTFNIKVLDGYYLVTNVTKEFTVKTGIHTLTAYTDIFGFTNIGGSTALTNDVITVSNQFGKFEHEIIEGWIAAQPKTTTYFKIRDWERMSSSATTNEYYTVGTPGWISDTDTREGYAGFKYVGNALNSGGTYNPVTSSSMLRIEAGTVLTNPLIVNPITVGQATYKILEGDLADGDSIITIIPSKDTDGQEETYMSLVTIDMTLILQELQKI